MTKYRVTTEVEIPTQLVYFNNNMQLIDIGSVLSGRIGNSENYIINVDNYRPIDQKTYCSVTVTNKAYPVVVIAHGDTIQAAHLNLIEQLVSYSFEHHVDRKPLSEGHALRHRTRDISKFTKPKQYVLQSGVYVEIYDTISLEYDFKNLVKTQCLISGLVYNTSLVDAMLLNYTMNDKWVRLLHSKADCAIQLDGERLFEAHEQFKDLKGGLYSRNPSKYDIFVWMYDNSDKTYSQNFVYRDLKSFTKFLKRGLVSVNSSYRRSYENVLKFNYDHPMYTDFLNRFGGYKGLKKYENVVYAAVQTSNVVLQYIDKVAY